MLLQSQTTAMVPLSPDDLELLERFLTAWCEENNVARTEQAAVDVAAALIDWYRLDPKYRSRVQLEQADDLPVSPQIQLLLRQMT